MKRKFLILSASFAFALTGCKNGSKKAEYSEFHEQVVAAAEKEGPKVKKMVINGTIESEAGKYTAKNLTIEESTDKATLSISDLGFVFIIGFIADMPVKIPEQENTQYFVGNGFRVKAEEAELAWDEYLNCTLIKGKVEKSSCYITAKYTYEK